MSLIGLSFELNNEQFEKAVQYINSLSIEQKHNIYFETEDSFVDFEIELPKGDSQKKLEKLTTVHDALKSVGYKLNVLKLTGKSTKNQYKTDCSTGSVYINKKTTIFQERAAHYNNYLTR